VLHAQPAFCFGCDDVITSYLHHLVTSVHMPYSASPNQLVLHPGERKELHGTKLHHDVPERSNKRFMFRQTHNIIIKHNIHTTTNTRFTTKVTVDAVLMSAVFNGITATCFSCHHGMACSQVADGGDGLQICRVAADILNKQSRTADRGWYSSLEVGRGSNYPHRRIRNLLRIVH
jgi:hypothetical protein